MTASDSIAREDFQRCAAFHGHICPGLSIGYRAARVAMERLQETRSEDEEVVAIVETDSCAADAVQVLTGCTFGKGNFFYRDHGKMALTLMSRTTGRGVRVCLKPNAMPTDDAARELMQRVVRGEATPEEEDAFRAGHLQRACDILEAPAGDLFTITAIERDLPERARIEPSEICAVCGEPTMPSRMETVGGRLLCRGCRENGGTQERYTRTSRRST